jgi:hypothetical protein
MRNWKFYESGTFRDKMKKMPSNTKLHSNRQFAEVECYLVLCRAAFIEILKKFHI